MDRKKSITRIIILIIGLAILANILADRFFVRIDLTKDKVYTLHKATKKILRNLEDPVTITVYYTENLPPEYSLIRKELKNKLVEISSISKGKINYEFIDPKNDNELKQRALQSGVPEVQVNNLEEDQIKAQKAFMGAVFTLGNQSEAIQVIQSLEGLEYEIAKLLKKLTAKEKQKIGIMQGHGEAGLNQIGVIFNELRAFYDVSLVYLNDTAEILDNYSTVLIIAPNKPFPQSHLDQLEHFVNKGRNLFLALNTVDFSDDMQYGVNVDTRLPEWLRKYGVIVNSDFVVDVQCRTVPVQMGEGSFSIIQFYYLPNMTRFADEPISKGLEEVGFNLVSSIGFDGDSTMKFTPLVLSSDVSGIKANYSIMDLVNRRWQKSDFPMSGLTVAASVEGVSESRNQFKMVVIGDGSFAFSDPQSRQVNPDNMSLIVNSVDWLSDDTGLVGLRTKGATSRPIEKVENAKRNFLKAMNLALPILLIIAAGIYRTLHNKSKRMKWMEAGHV